jgi:hypothetical protein
MRRNTVRKTFLSGWAAKFDALLLTQGAGDTAKRTPYWEYDVPASWQVSQRLTLSEGCPTGNQIKEGGQLQVCDTGE